MTKISYYKKITAPKVSSEIEFPTFVDNIINGEWQDIVLSVRNAKDEKEKKNLKQNAPLVTISGTFSERSVSGLKTHSNYIAIDIDKVENIEEVISQLKNDKYTRFLFRSISGNGLCLVVQIEGKKHLEAFRGLSMYYFNNYSIVIDRSCKDVSRARFISYDPDAYYCENSLTFKEYLPEKEYTEKKVDFVPHANDDIAYIVEQIQSKNINICNSYEDWLNVCFALSTLGEEGYHYFKIISNVSALFRPGSKASNPALVEKQWQACRKAKGQGITIKTFFFLAKNAGCDLQTQNTKELTRVAFFAKKRGASKNDAKEQMIQTLGASEQVAEQITKQVYENKVNPSETKQDLIISYLKQNYNIKYNLLNENLEIDNIQSTERRLNSIFLECSKISNISFELFQRILFSEEFKEYNPLSDYFTNSKDFGKGYVRTLLNCFKTKTNKDFFNRILSKWLIGLVGGAFNKPANFAIVLISEKTQIGKTTFFRKLLPEKLSEYKTEVNFDSPNKKDDIIPLTKNILCLVDEWQEVSVKNGDRLRWIITASDFDIRKSYRKDESKYKRYASIAGTSNPSDIISNPEYNRRIIPLEIEEIDLNTFLEIDKDALFSELYQVYKSGYNYELDEKDVTELREVQLQHEVESPEASLILTCFRLPLADETATFYTASQVQSIVLAKHKQMKMNTRNVGRTLKKLGFQRILKKINGVPLYGYLLIELK